MTAVEWLCNEWLYLDQQFDMCLIDRNIYWDKLRQIQEQAKEMEKQEKIELLKSLVYSVCIGDDVEDVEEWLKEHELNKSE